MYSAPPFHPATLFVNVEFINVEFACCEYVWLRPPFLLYFLLKLEFFTINSPQLLIAPEDTPHYYFQNNNFQLSFLLCKDIYLHYLDHIYSKTPIFSLNICEFTIFNSSLTFFLHNIQLNDHRYKLFYQIHSSQVNYQLYFHLFQ